LAAICADGARSIVLLSPLEPGFWQARAVDPEFRDEIPNPLDRWSLRTITRIAEEFDAEALFPFGGPPYHPFISWALNSGQVFSSPVSLLVHPVMGLWCSFRGAIALPFALEMPKAQNPCDTCTDKPCLTACPPRALTAKGYDIPACHGFLNTISGENCLSGGCAVRKACPVSQSYGRVEKQSAHHMRHFHK
jgi:epoxyqueuosine reductase